MSVRPPDECETMGEVRAGVDELDARLVDLLAERFGYMRAAARIKQDRAAVRDEPRKAEVVEAARQRAMMVGVPVGLVGDVWERLVEASIAYELETWDRLHDGPEA